MYIGIILNNLVNLKLNILKVLKKEGDYSVSYKEDDSSDSGLATRFSLPQGRKRVLFMLDLC